MHDPEHAEAMQEARRVGGLRRRREKTVAIAFGIEGVTTVAQLQRIIEVVVFEGLALENTPERGRLLISAVASAQKLLGVGEHEERLVAVEGILEQRLLEMHRRR